MIVIIRISNMSSDQNIALTLSGLVGWRGHVSVDNDQCVAIITNMLHLRCGLGGESCRC